MADENEIQDLNEPSASKIGLAKLSTEEREEIHQTVMDQMSDSNDGYEFICKNIKEELDFRSGEQWSDDDKNLREGRPCLVIDKMGKYLDKVEGYFRNNPPQANVKSRFNATEDDAKIIKGYLRSFLASPKTKAAVQTACGHMASVGYGWIYVAYEKDNARSFDEYSPVTRRIDDPRSVRIDKDSIEADGSDATWASLLRTMSKKDAEERYDEELLTSFDEIPDEYASQWVKGDQIVVADYWWKEDVDDVLTEIRMRIDGAKRRLFSKELEKIDSLMYEVIRYADTKRSVVKMVTVTGAGIVDYIEWPGTDLPIIPCYGAQVWCGEYKVYTGLVRKAMDPQRLINYYASAAAEVTALSPRVPFIIEEQQKEGHGEEWDTASVDNFSNLTYKHVDGVPPPSRSQQTADVSPLIASVTSATNDLADVMGIYEASLGQETNQKSGTAIQNATQNSDQVIAIMIDNGRRAVIRAAQVAVNMLPFLATEERTLRYLSEEGEESEIPVNTGTPVEVTDVKGIEKSAVDLSSAVFEVVVEEGESYQTRKQESANGGLELLNILPEGQRGAVAAEVVRNLPWPNSKKLSRVLAATLDPSIRALIEGDENSKEDPQAIAIMEGMKQELAQADVEAQQKDMQIEELRGVLQQLQMAVLSTAQDNDTKLQIAAMNNATKIELAQIDAGTTQQKTEAEIRADLIMQEIDGRIQKNAKQMDAALKLAEKYLGGSSVGPTGNIAGQLRGVP